jgi:hypothetical protein
LPGDIQEKVYKPSEDEIDRARLVEIDIGAPQGFGAPALEEED